MDHFPRFWFFSPFFAPCADQYLGQVLPEIPHYFQANSLRLDNGRDASYNSMLNNDGWDEAR